jgi:asparagine synthase (glutamine-hydrolysing)
MSGICGIVDYGGTRLAKAGDEALQPVLNALHHRGPDFNTTLFAPPALLGATHRANLDPSGRAPQPIRPPSDSLKLVLDGMIYNGNELRKQLEPDEATFHANSDADVVLCLYARLGPACLRLLRGMFAFAVWDPQRQKLFLARDRMGEKPLVYCHAGSAFAFASEIPALLQLDWIPRRVDPVGLHLGLCFVQAPAPWTAFQDIRRLAPGSWLELSRNGMRLESYWSCRFESQEPFGDLQSAAAAVARCLDETTQIMCRGDAPLGATLSGGLDSGSVVASMSRNLRRFHTFRVSNGPLVNPSESRSSERIARMYGAEHHQFLVPPDSISPFEDVVSVFGEPIGMQVVVSVENLARRAKRFVDVVLSGLGGDELFGGYPDHSVLRRLERQTSLQLRGERRAPPHIGPRQQTRHEADLLSLPLGQVFGTLRFSELRQLAGRAYGPRMKEAALHHDPADLCEEVFADSGAKGLLDGFLAQQLMLLNQYGLASIIDAETMRYAVQFRSPFLDVRMVELAMRIPARLKIGLWRGTLCRKVVLREAMRDRLPPQTLCAPDKLGIGGTIPFERWLHGETGRLCHGRLTDPALRDLGLFNTQALEELWLLSLLNPAVPADWLWGIATISAWLERYF